LLYCKGLRLVLRDGLVGKLRLLCPHTKLTHTGLIGEFCLNLTLAKTLLAHRRIYANALQSGLRNKVIGTLILLLHRSVVRLTTAHQTLVRKLLL
jgi:hypothetical protein